MRNIIVTTPKSEMENAYNEAEYCKINGGSYFRRFTSKPKGLEVGSKIFYVEDGFIRGFAIVSELKFIENKICDVTEKIWDSGTYAFMPAETWNWITPISMRGFQNWRYFNGDFKIIGQWLDDKPETLINAKS